MAYKPENYTSASPYLMLKDTAATIKFLEDAFDAKPLRMFPNDKGGMMHGEMQIDDSVIMMGEVDESQPASVHVYVPDAELAFDRAVLAGGTVVQEVMSKGDGDRRGGVADPNGVIWWMATQE